MSKTSSVLSFLLAGSILPVGFLLSQEAGLRPLPIATTGLVFQTITATGTDQADLQRAGYILKDRDSERKAANGRERSYTFEGPSGSSAMLVDNEYPDYFLSKRKLVFDVTFSAKEGNSIADLGAATPQLVAEAQKALSENRAIVAGLSYLATASGSVVTPEALQAAVIDYVQQYRQPSTLPREACAGCGSQFGFGDEYYGGPETSTPLNVRETGWTIAGTRRYLNGDSIFKLQVIAKIPRS